MTLSLVFPRIKSLARKSLSKIQIYDRLSNVAKKMYMENLLMRGEWNQTNKNN